MKRKLLTALLLVALLMPVIGGMIPVSSKNAKTDYDFTGIYLTRSSVDLKVGGSCTVAVRRINVPRSDKLTWHSWDPSVATVGTNGEITAVGVGTTKVTVLHEDYSAECIVTVTEEDPVYDNYDHTVELLQDFYDLRFGMFLHFNSSTYEFAQIGGDWAGEQRESTFNPRSWNPSELDCNDWAKAAKSAGMTFAVLTTKHHDGFDLWDSAYTDYDVGSATDKTDVVKEFTDACREEGIAPALYFSMLDIKHKITSSDCDATDIEFIKAQITELLTGYGEIPFIIFDAWNAYWGGPNYDLLPYDEIVNLVHTLQPNCLVINISCEANNVHSEVAMFESAAGQNVPDWFSNVNISCNTVSKHWFWCDSYPTDTFKSVDWVLNENVNPFTESDTVFILNVAPNQKGALIDKYKTLLSEIGNGYEKPADSVTFPEEWAADYDYRQNLLFHKTATQGSNDGKATAGRAVDGYTDPEFSHETSSRTGSDKGWWRADIGYVADFGKLKIYAGEGGANKLKNAYVFFSDEPLGTMDYSRLTQTEGITCVPLTDAEISEDLLTVDLTGQSGRYVGILTKTGSLTLAEVVLNPAGASDDRIVGLRTTFESVTVNAGTAFADLELPETAQFVTADGSLKILPLIWDEESYDPDRTGSYELTARPEGSDYTVSLSATVHDSSRFSIRTPQSVTASSIWSADSDWAAVKNVISDTGMVIDASNILYSTHDNAYNATSMWHSADGVTQASLTFTFNSPVTLSHLLIWNHNQKDLTDRGVKEMEVFYAETADGEWKSAGVYTLNKANDDPNQTATDLLNVGTITAAKIKLDLKKNYGSSSHIGLSQVFFLKCADGAEKSVAALSSFELLSKYDYPEADYNAAEAIYQQCVQAVAQNSGKADALAASLSKAVEDLATVKSVKKLSGMDALTLKITAGDALPETIEILVDGVTTAVPVIWQTLPDGALTASGTLTLRGRIAGTPTPVSVALSVKGKSSAALEALIENYNAIDLSVYTSESAAAFTAALENAKTVVANADSAQDAINSAKAELKNAKYGLTEPVFATLSLKEQPPVIESDDDSGKTPDDSENPVVDPDTAPADPAVTDNDSNKSSAGLIAGIAIGAAVLVGVAITGVILLRKKKK
ncbi:MAG: alpha-L-fucosidase [Clostridia bacterium]|nr:alpha-L-fucosidase [Clostridia bacterium]